MTVHWVYLALFAAILLHTQYRDSITEISFKLHKVWKFFILGVVAILGIGMFWIHDASMLFADFYMRNAYNGIVDGQIGIAVDTQGFTPDILQKVAVIEKDFQSATQWAPNEAFYALNSSHFILSELFAGQKLSSIEILSAVHDALHASRLRGYDGFSLSVYSELKKFSGLTF